MIRLFSGEDNFTAYHQARAKAQALAESAGRELKVVDADDISLESFKLLLSGQSMFSAGYVILAKRLLENKSLVGFLQERYDKLAATEIVIWQPDKVDGRTGLVKQLKSEKLVKDFPATPKWELENWVRGRLQELGVKVAANVSALLVELVGEDKWRLEQELQKLGLLSKVQSGVIEAAAVRDLVSSEVVGDIWQLLDQLTTGNKSQAVGQLQNIMSYEEQDQYVIAMLSRELDLMATLSAAQQTGMSATSLGLHPFVLEKTQRKLPRFPLEKIKRLQSGLLRLDTAIKSGVIDPFTGLLIYLLSW